nr:hypothetical protein BdHM001_36440 [Bdellovibrio sp. HM001]
MSRAKYLEELRESNQGYNPEPIAHHEHLAVVSKKLGILTVRNSDTGEDEEWLETSAESEVEFIERWPGKFGLIVDGRFYYRA